MKADGECVQDYLQIVSGNSYDVFCGNMSDLDPNIHTLQSSSSSVDNTGNIITQKCGASITF
jgi:hypothetical protein